MPIKNDAPKERVGIDYLAIPCEIDPDERNKPRPIYIYGTEESENNHFHYKCPKCGHKTVNYKACAYHMGLISNVMGNCPGTLKCNP